MTSYFQSWVNSLTPSTIWSGVNLGPEANFRGSVCPIARIFTLCPPTSTTSTFAVVFCELSVTPKNYYTTGTQRTQSRTADEDSEWTRMDTKKEHELQIERLGPALGRDPMKRMGRGRHIH